MLEQSQQSDCFCYYFVFDSRVTLGNQVDGVKLLDPQVVRAFREKYPDPKMAMLPPDKAKKYYETGRID